MNRLFVKKIKNCHQCPHYEFKDFEVGCQTCHWCKLSNKEIRLSELHNIPSWCRLPVECCD